MDPDPDPGGPKTCGSGGSGFGSGSATLAPAIIRSTKTARRLVTGYCKDSIAKQICKQQSRGGGAPRARRHIRIPQIRA
jgi:hypothetical protein